MNPDRPGRPEAAAEIWRWRPEETASDESDSEAGRARRRGLLQGGAAWVVGVLLFRFWSPVIGSFVVAIGSILAVSAALSPRGLYAGVERLIEKLGALTGRGLSWVLLAPVYYLVFLPFGLAFRRGSRDRMKRRLEPEADSYWEAHEGQTAASTNLERQY